MRLETLLPLLTRAMKTRALVGAMPLHVPRLLRVLVGAMPLHVPRLLQEPVGAMPLRVPRSLRLLVEAKPLHVVSHLPVGAMFLRESLAHLIHLVLGLSLTTFISV